MADRISLLELDKFIEDRPGRYTLSLHWRKSFKPQSNRGSGNGLRDGESDRTDSGRASEGASDVDAQSAAVGVLDVESGRPSLRVASRATGPWIISKPDGDGFERAIGKVLTRAGWQRPRFDPSSICRLIPLRERVVRFEFILDTNAMADGSGHWLADAFGDRCDLVATAVSLRELQNLYSQCNFYGSEISLANLNARQTYLAAMRFRENPMPRVLWRELEVDDTALIVSDDSKTPEKSNRGDTMMLRTVRRSINDRVRGLARFFVTGDSALARRAVTELPEGTSISTAVRDLRLGAVYIPAVWWPGRDEGSATSLPGASRLIWEFLALADRVVLTKLETDSTDSTDSIEFSAFENPMWPSDYVSPAVIVTVRKQGTARGVGISQSNEGSFQGGGTASASGDASAAEPAQAPSAQAPVVLGLGVGTREPPPATVPEVEQSLENKTVGMPNTRSGLFGRPSRSVEVVLSKRIRFGAKSLLSTIALIVSRAAGTSMPASALVSGESERHFRWRIELLEAIGLVKTQGTMIKLQPSVRFRQAWRSNDLDEVSAWFRRYGVFADQCVSPGVLDPSDKVVQCARVLAQLMGQGMSWDHEWWPGAASPSPEDVRAEIENWLDERKGHEQPTTIASLFIDVFLKKLQVSPVRMMKAWEAMQAHGVFAGLEFRSGGTPTGRYSVEVARLNPDSWLKERVDIDGFLGYRDIVDRR